MKVGRSTESKANRRWKVKTEAKEVIIRKLRAEDFGDIIELDKRVVGKDRASSWPQRVASHFKTYEPLLSHVAEAEGKIVGFIIGDIRGSEYALPLGGWVDIEGVDPAYQRQGIGRKLIEAFERECRRYGVKTRIMVQENDERILKFVRSLGFRRGQLIDFEK